MQNSSNNNNNNQMQSSTSTMHSSFNQTQSGQQQASAVPPSYRAPTYDTGAVQMPVMSNRQNSTSHAMSLKDLATQIGGDHQQLSHSSVPTHQVSSMPNELTFQARQNEQMLKQQQQQQNYFLLQQQQQQQMHMIQQHTNRLPIYNQFYNQQEMQAAGDSPLNFQKSDPLLSTSTNPKQQFEETMMDGIN